MERCPLPSEVFRLYLHPLHLAGAGWAGTPGHLHLQAWWGLRTCISKFPCGADRLSHLETHDESSEITVDRAVTRPITTPFIVTMEPAHPGNPQASLKQKSTGDLASFTYQTPVPWPLRLSLTLARWRVRPETFCPWELVSSRPRPLGIGAPLGLPLGRLMRLCSTAPVSRSWVQSFDQAFLRTEVGLSQ